LDEERNAIAEDRLAVLKPSSTRSWKLELGVDDEYRKTSDSGV
jgi:hypothetical protein